jgi:acyl dehydratase
MSDWRRRAIEGLQPGDEFVLRRTFSEADTRRFGDLSRDFNPVHYDRGFAGARGFPDLICHGLLVGGMLCELGGQVAWLASSISFRFVKPVYFGDTVTCRIRITDVTPRYRARATARFENQHGTLVMEAAMEGVIPGPEEAEVLARVRAEGDPSNPMAGG